jgi:GMP synthase-like glutamine amidotransferase
MRVHVLQHVSFEGLGGMEPWLRKRDAAVTITRFFEAPQLPALDAVDLIIAMGGPMSVNDEAALPWLVAEKQFIHDAIRQGVSVLGICLGAQLIASALGARVYPNGQREIGWFDIEAVPGPPEVFRFPATARVFHWHGETFDLPEGAVQLARSAACENQAFQLGRKVMGLQFHLEITPPGADALISHCREELVQDAFVQSEAALRNVPFAAYADSNALMGEVLDHFAPC